MAAALPLSTQIVETVAAELDCNPIDLVPLQDTIDADAIDALFDTAAMQASPFVTISYHGFRVFVEDGDIELGSLPLS